MNATRPLQALALLTLAANLSANAADTRNAHDPLEKVNRAMFKFNDKVDKAVLKPVAKAYKAVLPQPVRTGVANFFANLEYPVVIANDLLQGKVGQGVHDTERLIFNSTFGIGGLFDIATLMRLPRHDEDFGQTLGVWGVGPGWYLVLPLLGPSTVRDAVALPADAYIDPLYRISDLTARYSLIGVNVVDMRSRIPPAAEQIQAEALDPYLFTRDAYLQRRQRQIEDGQALPPPPLEEEEEGGPPEGGKPVPRPGQK